MQRSAVRTVFRALKSVFEPTCRASLIEEQETESSQTLDPIQNSRNPVGSLPAVHPSSEAASTHGNLDLSHASSLWVGRTPSMLDSRSSVGNALQSRATLRIDSVHKPYRDRAPQATLHPMGLPRPPWGAMPWTRGSRPFPCWIWLQASNYPCSSRQITRGSKRLRCD